MDKVKVTIEMTRTEYNEWLREAHCRSWKKYEFKSVESIVKYAMEKFWDYYTCPETDCPKCNAWEEKFGEFPTGVIDEDVLLNRLAVADWEEEE